MHLKLHDCFNNVLYQPHKATALQREDLLHVA